MEGLLSIVNQLQKVISLSNVRVSISLPQIVVVGAQSAGKSSVLECIVGKDFLPRGSGIVTRRPLIIQCHHTEEGEYAVFHHCQDRLFDDFNEVRKEIERDTIKEAGNNKGVVSQPIILEIHSPQVIDLTLVDLPGLTKNPVGDQPKNIVSMIEEMALEYIKAEHALILAISPGNNDIANSDALKIARDVDPKGERTLSVITKLDIMDKGTSAINILLGEEYSLKFGHIGVVCRNQEDIKNNVPIADHLEKEADFFRNHPDYQEIQDQTGIPFLTKKLQEILFDHLQKTLPSIKAGIDRQLREREVEAKIYGEPVKGNRDLERNIILKVIREFSRNLEEVLEGKDSSENNEGTKIRNILFDNLERKTREINPLICSNDRLIQNEISNSNGIYGTLLIPEQAFRTLAQSTVNLLKEPAIDAFESVKDTISALIKRIKVDEFRRFSIFHVSVCEISESLIEDCYKTTSEIIDDIFTMEYNYINIQHPDFMGGIVALAKINQKIEEEKEKIAQNYPGQKVSTPIISDEKKYVEVTKLLIKSYFDIVKKTIGDMVPKAIMFFLVMKVMRTLGNHLSDKLLKDEILERTLDEGKLIPQKREACKSAIKTLRQAKAILRQWGLPST
ncbi:unnamed protein product [Blepharisma stoltei]|uniref:Uncharacterized protein n=1 Tax=Blepharisma stoltei TaxID=1481888 RepID=A0AAU9IAD2_9CILI|nr:unnamed protein product [Blepharisma stoltei]